MKPENLRLWEACTYERTQRLEDLLKQEQVETLKRSDPEWPNHRDISEMWGVYKSECFEVGYTPTVTDFAHWILGDNGYTNPDGTVGERCMVN